MANMASDEFITFFFNKRLGIMKDYCTGKQDMSFYGEEQQDYELIFDFIVLPRDADTDNIMTSKHNFLVNTATKEIEIKEEAISKFKVKKKKIK